MNQAEVGKLMNQLRFKVQPKPWRLRDFETQNRGHRGRLVATRRSVTALIQNERLELAHATGVVTREYTERLLQEAVMHGDKHKPTMELADWWLKDKSLIHKLFKVLVPRFKDMDSSYTRFFHGPFNQSLDISSPKNRVIVELKGHPFPPLAYSNITPNRGLISNVLLAEARREARLKDEYTKVETR
eukprot:TRINITY_DN2586_c0_g1_i3.p1 TRINITY_DN2586_c0_g1~~TRINITY_DN2586_c0_g1_i3.p1  ORF type:complete len:187 (-),score=14.38 TRINITY_DN2586_c0_g1_i3:215-775(-)